MGGNEGAPGKNRRPVREAEEPLWRGPARVEKGRPGRYAGHRGSGGRPAVRPCPAPGEGGTGRDAAPSGLGAGPRALGNFNLLSRKTLKEGA